MRIFWLPDPPPDWVSKYLTVSIAGIAGAVLGGLLITRVESNPMPGISGIWAALAGASILVGLVRGVTRGARGP
jgi:uncharacterized membrane protein YeaQ/YmgE (transglycosylase-associated protein family)